MNLLPVDFHFLRLYWFLTVIPAMLVLFFLWRRNGKNGTFEHFCDPILLKHLLLGNVTRVRGRNLPFVLLFAAWLLTVVSLAGPVWKRQPQPVFRLQESRIIVLDLSQSMAAEDVKPSRLKRAVFKIQDILKRNKEGRTGFVVFAGDAHVVVPMTEDVETIKSMLPSLSVDIMPVSGDSLMPALHMATMLLKQGGAKAGEILLLSDGVADAAASISVASELRKRGIHLSVLGIGTEEGAPIPTDKGWYSSSESGIPVLARFDSRPLQELARSGGGEYSGITVDGHDLDRLLTKGKRHSMDEADQEDSAMVERWQEEGIFLVPVIILLAATGLRKGWLLLIIFLVLLRPAPSLAFEWIDLWQNKEQRAMQALKKGDAETAAKMFSDPRWRGMAQYKAGDYQGASESFKSLLGSDYNLGNSLARAERLEEALEAYNRALESDPDDADARANHDIVEKLLQEQKKKQDTNQDQSGKSGDVQSKSKEKKDKESASGNSQQSSDGNEARNDKQDSGEKGEKLEKNKDSASGEQDRSSQTDKNRPDESNSADNQAFAGHDDKLSTENKSEDRNVSSQAQKAEEEKDSNGKEQNTKAVQGVDEKEEVPPKDIVLDQWLRQVPDDPSGLLRRKFLLESKRNRKKK